MEKGDMLIREAEKKLKGGFLSNLMGAGSRYEDAADLYIKAGNAFKLAKNWEAGAEAFRKAAGCYMHAQSAHEAATAYINAANCIKKANPRGALPLHLLIIFSIIYLHHAYIEAPLHHLHQC